MIYWNNLAKKENIDVNQFMKIVDFLNMNGLISPTFFGHHDIYSFYQDLRVYKTEKEARIETCLKFNIGKVTFYNIKKKFKNS